MQIKSPSMHMHGFRLQKETTGNSGKSLNSYSAYKGNQ